MSILKKKVRLVQELQGKKLQAPKPEIIEQPTTPTSETPIRQRKAKAASNKRRKGSGSAITPEKIRCAKNIVKNYGKAIATFACSNLAEPYLKEHLQEEGISLNDFITYATAAKKSIENIDSFRNVLLIKDEDSDTEVACKKIFQHVGEVFIKSFSANWIYNTKIVHKLTYLKYRFKMLRRLRNPQFFTYLKG